MKLSLTEKVSSSAFFSQDILKGVELCNHNKQGRARQQERAPVRALLLTVKEGSKVVGEVSVVGEVGVEGDNNIGAEW